MSAFLTWFGDGLARLLKGKAASMKVGSATAYPESTTIESARRLRLAWADLLDTLAGKARELVVIYVCIVGFGGAVLLTHFVWTS